MQYTNITTDRELLEFCERAQSAPRIGFDTEFVSEDTYTPDLCLVQLAVGDELAVVDSRAVQDHEPFWKLLAAAGHETIVHAGREEYLFCMRAVGQRPHGLIDLQLAAGLIGVEYPASYGNLVSRLLGRSLPKGETRTDWRRRPLTQRQIDYALQDVVHLEAMRDAIFQRLEKLGRVQWLEDEMLAWQASLDESVSRRRWRRVSGISGLSARSLAIVRELWQWRETVAQDRNIPSRRVLRDDLIVEMARRQTADPNRIRAVRGMNFRDVQRRIDDIAAAVQTALNLPDDELPRGQRRDLPSQLTVLGQFLTTAIASVCRRAEVAPSLVCSVQDVRDFVAWELNINRSPDDDPPALAIGWRREVVGDLIDDMLSGRVAIRIDDPLSDHPLVMDRLTGDA